MYIKKIYKTRFKKNVILCVMKKIYVILKNVFKNVILPVIKNVY